MNSGNSSGGMRAGENLEAIDNPRPGRAKYALASTSHGIERCDVGAPIGYHLEIFFLTPLGHFS